jgi:hypothetical protein
VIYSYISGEHHIYDSGIVSYYGTLQDNNARAVKFSGYERLLAAALIRNYADASHTSADMEVHVWGDYGGIPGSEMIGSFDVTPEADITDPRAMTRIDFREHEEVNLNGSLWIGFSAPYGIVYSTLESVDEPEATNYGRSCKGTWTGSEWTWVEDSLYNYHIRAVFKVEGGIESGNVPELTALYQNYPNPFNPVTTINFSLAKDSKVKIVVYDVTGRVVTELADKEMASGSHSVNFDASKLVSGIYYCNFKAGSVNQTKKMMLLK